MRTLIYSPHGEFTMLVKELGIVSGPCSTTDTPSAEDVRGAVVVCGSDAPIAPALVALAESVLVVDLVIQAKAASRILGLEELRQASAAWVASRKGERMALTGQTLADALQAMADFEALPRPTTQAQRLAVIPHHNTTLLAIARWVRRQAGG